MLKLARILVAIHGYQLFNEEIDYWIGRALEDEENAKITIIEEAASLYPLPTNYDYKNNKKAESVKEVLG